jgi:mannosyltransferase
MIGDRRPAISDRPQLPTGNQVAVRPSVVERVRVWLNPLLVVVLAMAALPLTLYQLGYQSLWLDEGTTHAIVTGRHIGALLVAMLDPREAYPLYHIVVKVCTRLLGDSEWALRLPSAIAGGLAVPVLYLLGTELRGRAVGLAAAGLLILAPWALRQAQDAKAYSLALLTVVVLALLLARALRLRTRGAWLWFLLVVLIAPFVHRLLLLSLLGCATAWTFTLPRNRRWPLLLAVVLAAVALLGAIAGSMQYQRASGQFVEVQPFHAALLTFAQFSVAQFAGTVPIWWFVPFALLLGLGLIRCARDLFTVEGPRAARARRGALVVVCVGGLPLALFLILLAIQPLYESRYLVGVFPFWLLLLAWAIAPHTERIVPSTATLLRFGVGGALLLLTMFVEQQALVQPERGIFSGARLKEDYSSAVRRLAEHVHPDDLVLLHPGSIRPLYEYYARRVATQPLPEPQDLTHLFQADISVRDLDSRVRPLLGSKKRAWLLIAPDHARVIDPPPTPMDDVGWIGLAFQYGDKNSRIQCGEQPYAGFTGVRLYCNNLPDIAGVVPEPEVPVEAVFNKQLRLRGYSVTPFEGGLKPGGTLPISLFWQPLVNMADTNYIVFIHLTALDDPRPLAQTDGMPMEGGQPTSRWTRPRALLHDDRTIPLPSTLPPGRYLLRMGLYQANDGARLPVEAAEAPVQDNAIVLGEVRVVP